jgi:ribonuclease P protein component
MPTITSAREIDTLFKSGRRAANRALLLMVLETPEARARQGRVLFVAGKRLGGAVTRNRSKRVLREAARRAGGPWPGFDVALVARESTATAGPAALDAAIGEALTRLGVRP